MPRPLAVVTGASTGIGAAFADLLAEEGHDLVLAADEPQVADTARRLATRGVRASAVVVDLSTGRGVEDLHAMIAAEGRPVDLAVVNAGTDAWGASHDLDSEAQLRVVDLDVRSTVHLAILLLHDMVAAGAGRLVLVSSVAGLAPGPGHAVYAASKAFVHSYAEAVGVELDGTGVSVTSLLPGPTRTSLFRRVGMKSSRVAQQAQADPRDVARRGYEAACSGADHATSGLANRLLTALGGVVTDRWKARLASRETDRVR
jgi:short-subunit dehydrogenase